MEALVVNVDQNPTQYDSPIHLVPNPFYSPMTPSPINIPPQAGCRPQMNQLLPSPGGVQIPDCSEFRKQENLIKKVNVGQLHVEVLVTSQKTMLKWPVPRTLAPIKFIIENTRSNGQKIETTINPKAASAFYLFKTIPGFKYDVKIQCKSQDDRFLVAEWSRNIRAEFDASEFKNLYQLCIRYLESVFKVMQEVVVIYRCKPKVYWNQIHDYSDGVMQKYLKDDNGQPANRINGMIKGLFFSAHLNSDGSMPLSSYFGDVRMRCCAFSFLDPEKHNFYFGDFYCNKVQHYVTVVICIINSETDMHCSEKLIKLDPYANPFLKMEKPISGQLKFFVNRTVIVELLYTESIPLSAGAFDTVEPIGSGTSKENGLPNNKECTICNLYPRAPKV